METFTRADNNEPCYFYVDSEHPYPYREDYTCGGVCFTFALHESKHVEEVRQYVKQLQNKRDIADWYVIKIKENIETISSSNTSK